MRRAATLCLMGSTLSVFVCWAFELAEASVGTLFPHLRERAAAVEKMRAEVDSFGPRLAQVLAEVAEGRTSLREATRAVEQYTAEHYPTFFVNLALVETDRPMRVKLARMLLSYFDDPPGDIEMPKIVPERRAALAQEYEEIAAAAAVPH